MVLSLRSKMEGKRYLIPGISGDLVEEYLLGKGVKKEVVPVNEQPISLKPETHKSLTPKEGFRISQTPSRFKCALG
jgi:hypothetical protein